VVNSERMPTRARKSTQPPKAEKPSPISSRVAFRGRGIGVTAHFDDSSGHETIDAPQTPSWHDSMLDLRDAIVMITRAGTRIGAVRSVS
jgi:hypothetical protein